MSAEPVGVVYLAAVGPRGVTTQRAAELLAHADAVAYPSDLDPSLLLGCSASAERIRLTEAGAVAGDAQTLIEAARRHAVVVRAYPDHPLALPAGVREAEELASAGVAHEVVPGVLTCTALATQARVSLSARTEPRVLGWIFPGLGWEGRDLASMLAGTPRLGGCVVSIDSSQLGQVLATLLEVGWSAETSIAVVWAAPGGVARETSGTLGGLAAAPPDASGARTAAVIVGAPVEQRREVAGTDARPLRGRRVVVTRPREQAGPFTAELERLGADVLQAPTIRIEPHPDRDRLRAAARDVGGFDWVVFTSTNGVEHFWRALREVGRDARGLAGVSVCAIGPATGAALEARGVVPDMVPERFVAESVVEALVGGAELEGSRILLPRAEIARAVLPDELRARGAEVVEVPAYRTVPDTSEAGMLREALGRGEVDVITFTSSSTVHNFVSVAGTDIGNALVASIGPITSATVRERGLEVHLEASNYTVPGLVRAIVEHFTDR